MVFAMSNSFELIEPFDIDDGELDGLSQQECFALGFEFSYIRDLIIKYEETGESFRTPIHSKNQNRVKAMCVRHPIIFTIIPHDDYPLLCVGQ